VQAITYELLTRLYDQIDYSEVAEDDVYDLNFEPAGEVVEAYLWYVTNDGFATVKTSVSVADYQLIRSDFNLERGSTHCQYATIHRVKLLVSLSRWHDTLVVDGEGDSLPEMQRIRTTYTRLRKIKRLVEQ
jgi:hypothetical protein